MENSRKVYVWKILIYFIMYSVVGFLIETIYAIFTKGMLESRKSFLYGPFCAIYGIAAVCMILVLEKYRKNPLKIYIFGTIIGLSVEYICSFLGEFLFAARWWDYSNSILNINGRVCIYYAIIWGFLSLILIYVIYPKTEKMLLFLEWNTNIITKTIKIFVLIILIFMLIDAIMTSYAVKFFINNVSTMYGVQIRSFESKPWAENFFTEYFSNEKMIMIYPNISVITQNDEVLYLGSVLEEYKNYYYKFKEK